MQNCRSSKSTRMGMKSGPPACPIWPKKFWRKALFLFAIFDSLQPCIRLRNFCCLFWNQITCIEGRKVKMPTLTWSCLTCESSILGIWHKVVDVIVVYRLAHWPSDWMVEYSKPMRGNQPLLAAKAVHLQPVQWLFWEDNPLGPVCQWYWVTVVPDQPS